MCHQKNNWENALAKFLAEKYLKPNPKKKNALPKIGLCNGYLC
jgi:hypothetical protein